MTTSDREQELERMLIDVRKFLKDRHWKAADELVEDIDALLGDRLHPTSPPEISIAEWTRIHFPRGAFRS